MSNVRSCDFTFDQEWCKGVGFAPSNHLENTLYFRRQKKGEIPLYSGVTEVAAKVRDSENSAAKAMVACGHSEWLDCGGIILDREASSQ